MERKIDRFDKYMKFKGLNDNKVTVECSLTIGVLGKSRKDGRDLSDRIIEIVLNKFPELNRVWLITGEGEMIVGKKSPDYTDCPLCKEKDIEISRLKDELIKAKNSLIECLNRLSYSNPSEVAKKRKAG